MHRVAALLPPVVGFDAAIAPTLFSSATDADGNALYEVVTRGLADGPASRRRRLRRPASAGPEALATADTVVILGTRYPLRPHRRRLAEGGIGRAGDDPSRNPAVSICTGAFILAAAGLLDGRPRPRTGSSPMRCAACIRSALDENVPFVDDGDILTSVARGGIDCACTSFGVTKARRWPTQSPDTAWCRHGARGSGAVHRPAGADAGSLLDRTDAREWALRHLDEELTVQRLAGHAKMSARTFNRRFREETGQSPGAWIRSRRVDRARELLESRDMPIDEVARLSGLGTGGNLRIPPASRHGNVPDELSQAYQGA